MKSKDFKLLFSITLVIFFVLLLNKINSNAGQFVRIKVGDTVVGTYSLDTNRIIELDNNTLEIIDGKIHMIQALCPDHLCIKQGYINANNESIVCLPNKISASIIDKVSTVKASGYYFNTYVEITAYDCEEEETLNKAMEICEKYEKICSKTNPNSELYALNHRTLPVKKTIDGFKCYEISSELYDMIHLGLEAGKESEGRFNIAIGPITELWNFTSNQKEIPSDQTIKEALQYISLDDIHLYDNNLIGFENDNNMLDLGGIAKGYIADQIKSSLSENNMKSAIISLGHNILCVGDKMGTPFNIGIKMPFEDNKTITSVDITDQSVVTSGIYERYFIHNNIIYHHIINPETGYPFKNDLSSITIISSSSTQGDVLSTSLFSLGSKGAIAYSKSHPDIQIILIDKNNKILEQN